jgi:hypothetical protein
MKFETGLFERAKAIAIDKLKAEHFAYNFCR